MLFPIFFFWEISLSIFDFYLQNYNIFNQKAILESESEWAQNKSIIDLKQKDLRKTVINFIKQIDLKNT